MSRIVIPPAYRLMIMSSSPPRRRAPLGTSAEANVELRSRGWSRPMSPTSVPTVFGVVPLRLLPDPCPARSPFSYPRWSLSSASIPRSRTALIISGKNPPSPVSDRPRSSVAAISLSNMSSSNSSRRSRRASGSSCSESFFGLVMVIVNLLQGGRPPPLTQTI